MRYGSVCSGIEAASVAWEPLGWSPQWFAEIDAFPSAVLAHRFPGVPNHGDFTRIGSDAAAIDLLVGGTPCQSFSVAGLRRGLADARGGLALEFLRLADRTRPRWLVWENVPGVLSVDGGRAFGSFLGGLAELGYGWAYRVLDAKHFGVPQRRRRVFVVGCAGDWRRAAAVLFERASLSGDPAPRREARERTAARAADGAGGCGGLGADAECDGALIADVCPTLRAGGNRTGGDRPPGTDVDTCESLIAQDGTGRGTPLVPVAFDPTQITSKTNRSNPRAGDPCHTLARGMHAPAIAFSSKDFGADASSDIAPTLRACGGHTSSHANAGAPPAIAFHATQISGDVSPALGTGSKAGTGSIVRRLTPKECERLQGFPDDWTLVPYRGKPAADGPRYRALGNSMAVPVMRWIGERIQRVSDYAEVDDAS